MRLSRCVFGERRAYGVRGWYIGCTIGVVLFDIWGGNLYRLGGAGALWAWAARFGAIAQLGERYNGIVEVKGSSPFSSTRLDCGSVFVRA